MARAEKYALLIGIDNYQSDEIQDLSAADADAEALAATLIEVGGFDKKNVFALTSRALPQMRPTRSNISFYLGEIKNKARAGDTVWVFYSGHGIERQDTTYLLPMDTDPRNDISLRDTAYETDKFTNALESLPVAAVIATFDMCRNDPLKSDGGSRSFSARGKLGDQQVRDLVLKKVADGGPQNVVTLFSCDRDQRSWESEKRKRGFYSYFLEQGLRGKAEEGSGVTIRSLSRYLDQQVPVTVKNEKAATQTPSLAKSSEAALDWVLVEPRPINLKIQTLPANAKIYLEGASDEGWPRSAPMQLTRRELSLLPPIPADRAETQLKLRAEASGYFPVSYEIQINPRLNRGGSFSATIARSRDGEIENSQRVQIVPGQPLSLPVWNLEKRPAQSTLIVESRPEGALAELVIGGVIKESRATPTSFTVAGQTEQKVVVRVKKSGFKTDEHQFSLLPGDKKFALFSLPLLAVPTPAPLPIPTATPARVAPISPAPVPQPTATPIPAPTPKPDLRAAISLESNPPGAQIFLDGATQSAGVTPFRIQRTLAKAEPLEIQLRLSKTGFESQTATLTLFPGFSGRTTLSLTPASAPVEVEKRAFVSLETDVLADSVLIDGRVVATQTPCDIEVPLTAASQKVKLVIQKAGYEPLSREVTLSRGRLNAFSLTLKRADALVNLDSFPSGAQVFINGRKIEGKTTPCLLEFKPEELTGKPMELKLVKDNFDEFVRPLSISRGSVGYYDYALPTRDQPAKLQVVSTPPGAKIWIDGALRTEKPAPAELEFLLPKGEKRAFTVRLELPGYAPLEEVVTLENGVAQPFARALKRQVSVRYDSAFAPPKFPRFVFSDDRAQWLALDAPQTLHLFSRDGQKLGSSSFDDAVNAFALSADWVAIGTGARTASTAKKLHLWNPKTNARLSLDTPQTVLSVAFSPDGTVLAAGDVEGHVSLWNVSTRTLVARFPAFSSVPGRVTALNFSPDGKTLAVGFGNPFMLNPLNCTVMLWNLQSSARPTPLFEVAGAGHKKSVTSLRFSRDGKSLISGGDDMILHVWNLESWAADGGRPRGQIALGDQILGVRALDFSLDGTLVACGTGDGKISVFNLLSEGGKWERIGFYPNQAYAQSVRFGDDMSLALCP